MPPDITISGADDVANITSVGLEETTILRKLLHMRHEQGFKGVSMVVEAAGGSGDGAGELHAASFPLEDACFPDIANWTQMWAEAWMNNFTHPTSLNTTYQKLHIGVRTGHCTRQCYKTVTFRSFLSLRVIGHGTSGWMTSSLLFCSSTGHPSQESYMTSVLPSCRAPPSFRTALPRPDTTTTRNTRPPTHTVTPTTPSTPTTPATITTPAIATSLATTTTTARGVRRTSYTEPTPESSVVLVEVVLIAVLVAVCIVVVVMVVMVMVVVMMIWLHMKQETTAAVRG